MNKQKLITFKYIIEPKTNKQNLLENSLFVLAIFINASKNTFGQKKFQISCTGLKVALKNCQNGTDEPMHEI